MKKLISMLLAVCLCLFAGVTLVGCGDNGDDGNSGGSDSIDGTYYLYDGETDQSVWVKLNGTQWSDNDEMSGRFELEGESISFYVTFEGEEELLLEGTLKDGKLTVGAGSVTVTYYLDGKAPAKGEENEDASTGELAFRLNEATDTYYVSGMGSFSGSKLVIPSEYNGKAVTGIDALGIVQNVKEIVIPDSVTYIGVANNGLTGAFECFSNLESIDFGNGIEEIPARVCYGIDNLKTIQFGTNVKYIGEKAFNKTGIETLVLPEGVETIDKYAFMQCESLVSVELPTTLRSVRQQGFSACKNLKTITYNGSEADWQNVSFENWALEPHEDCQVIYKK